MQTFVKHNSLSDLQKYMHFEMNSHLKLVQYFPLGFCIIIISHLFIFTLYKRFAKHWCI